MADGMNMTDGSTTPHTHSFAFGDPVPNDQATRVIEITATDDFRFNPSNIVVSEGEIVTFRVENLGAIIHDFTLGDADIQDQHEEAMSQMGGGMEMSHDDPNVFSVEAGETMEMTWHMTRSGEVLIGCHQPGHYAAGMKGIVNVEG